MGLRCAPGLRLQRESQQLGEALDTQSTQNRKLSVEKSMSRQSVHHGPSDELIFEPPFDAAVCLHDAGKLVNSWHPQLALRKSTLSSPG